MAGTLHPPRWPMPPQAQARYRGWLIWIVALATIIKLFVAATTFGTNDVATWMRFAKVVAHAGPVGIYKVSQTNESLENYNHPPLIGYLLMLVSLATRWGLSFPLAIRIPSIASDAVTPFLVFSMLRRRRALADSFAASVIVAVSPVLFAISGFHGNTDPVFVMLSLLSLYLLVERRSPGLAGVALACAVSVKIVPVVFVPTLVAFALIQGWRYFSKFALGAGALLAVTWGPVVLQAWSPFKRDVLGYAGSEAFRHWGLVQLAEWAGNKAMMVWLPGPGRFAVIIIASLVPAIVVFRRPDSVVEAVGLAMCAFFVLSPAFAVQYLAWVVAPASLISLWSAACYNLLAGGFLVEIYTRWSGHFPWYEADGSLLTSAEVAMAMVVWVSLIAVVAEGIRRIATLARREPSVSS